MKYAKRMVLVPEEFMDMLERKEHVKTIPTTKSMIRLDKTMDDISLTFVNACMILIPESMICE